MWEMVDGAKTVEARPAVKGFQDPDLEGGIVDTLGCVSPRSSNLQVSSPSLLKEWK